MMRHRYLSPEISEIGKSHRSFQGRKTSRSSNSSVNRIVHLQRSIGNQALQRLIKAGALQAKLRVGQPNDQYEQEADRVADQVMRMPDLQRQPEEEEEQEETLRTKPLADQITPLVQRQPEEEEEEAVQAKSLADQITPLVQRQVEPEEEEEEEPIQTNLTDSSQVQRQESEEEEEEPIQTRQSAGQTSQASHGLQAQIHSLKGGGQPLSKSERAFFESRFGYNFSQVRIHTDSKAAESAQAVNAKAFTTGRNIVFGAGQYAPETSKGQQLLAHELTHMVQQGASNELSVGSIADRTSPKKAVYLSDMSKDYSVYRFIGNSTISSMNIGNQSIAIQRTPIFHHGTFVGGNFRDDELQNYLDEGEVGHKIRDDNRAREIVRRWLDPNNSNFTNLSIQQRILLIRQMLRGSTLDDDERAILELLTQDISFTDRIAIILDHIGQNRLRRKFQGSERATLDEIILEIERSTPPPDERLPFLDDDSWNAQEILRRLGQLDRLQETDSDIIRCVQAVSLAQRILIGPKAVIDFLHNHSQNCRISSRSIRPELCTILINTKNAIEEQSATYGDISRVQEALHDISIRDTEATPEGELGEQMMPTGRFPGTINYTPLDIFCENIGDLISNVSGLDEAEQMLVLVQTAISYDPPGPLRPRWEDFSESERQIGHQILAYNDGGTIFIYDPGLTASGEHIFNISGTLGRTQLQQHFGDQPDRGIYHYFAIYARAQAPNPSLIDYFQGHRWVD